MITVQTLHIFDSERTPQKKQQLRWATIKSRLARHFDECTPCWAGCRPYPGFRPKEHRRRRRADRRLFVRSLMKFYDVGHHWVAPQNAATVSVRSAADNL
jgi:hypothetical protein